VTVTVSDRAGNRTVVTRKLKLTPPPKHGRRAHRR